MFGSNRSGEPQNPRRAQEIATEARQRLAAKGGKPSDMPGMVQQIIAERRMMDEQDRSTDRSPDGYQMPNNMERYVDQVLQMSGMMQAPQQGQQLPASGPIPGSRDDALPIGEMEGPPMPEDGADNGEAEKIIQEGESKGMGVADIAAALTVAGLGYAAMRYLSKRTTALPEGNETLDPNGAIPALADQRTPQPGTGPRIANLPQLEGPEAQKLLTGPRADEQPKSAVDQTIDEIDTPEQKTQSSDPYSVMADDAAASNTAAAQPKPDVPNNMADRSRRLFGEPDNLADRADSMVNGKPAAEPDAKSNVYTTQQARQVTEAMRLLAEGKSALAWEKMLESGAPIPDAFLEQIDKDPALTPAMRNRIWRSVRGAM